MIKVLGISGSLRQQSFNTRLLKTAVDLAPDGMRVRLASIDLPLYNEDLRGQGDPDPVRHFRSQIADADAVLIATPEYNFSVPGVLKNAIDWASRPPDQPFNQKPVAIMGGSPGRIGTARAQNHLRQTLGCLNASVLNKPGVMVGGVMGLFDDNGQMTDLSTREHIAKLLVALAAHVDSQSL